MGDAFRLFCLLFSQMSDAIMAKEAHNDNETIKWDEDYRIKLTDTLRVCEVIKKINIMF